MLQAPGTRRFSSLPFNVHNEPQLSEFFFKKKLNTDLNPHLSSSALWQPGSLANLRSRLT